MAIDWKALEENFNSFKPQAKEGTYKVKLEKVEIKELGSGSIAATFKFKNGEDCSYPWCTHWISTKNPGWTQWHHHQLLQVLGIRQEDAKAAIEKTTEANNNDELIRKYQAIYNKVAAKAPSVEIVVRPQLDQNGEFRYSQKGYQQFESEFTDPRVFTAQQIKQTAQAETGVEEPIQDESGIDLDEVPF